MLMPVLSAATLPLPTPFLHPCRRALLCTVVPSLPLKRIAGVAASKGRSRRLAVQASVSEVAPTAAATYGTLLLSGGLFAYLRSGSKGSIIGGASGAVLMAAAFYLMQTPETKVVGDALGFGSAFIFSAVFGIRLFATRKLAPAGPLLGLSLGSLLLFASAYLQDKV